jgi:hypothetical protein
MTVKEYLIQIEEKLEQSLRGEMKEYIPRILSRIEPLSLHKFINEGDPVLDLVEFKKIFDDTVTKIVTDRLKTNGTLSIIEGPFQTIILKDTEFRIGLN